VVVVDITFPFPSSWGYSVDVDSSVQLKVNFKSSGDFE
jgi:hypothetical protein